MIDTGVEAEGGTGVRVVAEVVATRATHTKGEDPPTYEVW